MLLSRANLKLSYPGQVLRLNPQIQFLTSAWLDQCMLHKHLFKVTSENQSNFHVPTVVREHRNAMERQAENRRRRILEACASSSTVHSDTLGSTELIRFAQINALMRRFRRIQRQFRRIWGSKGITWSWILGTIGWRCCSLGIVQWASATQNAVYCASAAR